MKIGGVWDNFVVFGASEGDFSACFWKKYEILKRK